MKKRMLFCRKANMIISFIAFLLLGAGFSFMDSDVMFPVPALICLIIGIPIAFIAFFCRKLSYYYRNKLKQ